jgi:hypothetical protein
VIQKAVDQYVGPDSRHAKRPVPDGLVESTNRDGEMGRVSPFGRDTLVGHELQGQEPTTMLFDDVEDSFRARGKSTNSTNVG